MSNNLKTNIKQTVETTNINNYIISIKNITKALEEVEQKFKGLKLDDIFKAFDSSSNMVVKKIKEIQSVFNSFKLDKNFSLSFETFNTQFEATSGGLCKKSKQQSAVKY